MSGAVPVINVFGRNDLEQSLSTMTWRSLLVSLEKAMSRSEESPRSSSVGELMPPSINSSLTLIVISRKDSEQSPSSSLSQPNVSTMRLWDSGSQADS